MKADTKKTVIISVCAVLCVAVMAVVDGIIQPGYVIKSAVKLCVFAVFPIIYMLLIKQNPIKLFHITGKGAIISVALGAGIFGVIIAAYFALRGVFEFSGITASLTSGAGVTKASFPYVATYIALCNSLLEEFFFRGVCYLILRKFSGGKYAAVFGALLFSVYHLAITDGWFSPVLLILTLVGLFAAGLIFEFADKKYDGIIPSYIIHASANAAINTIGLILFGII